MDFSWPFRGAPTDGVIGVDAHGRIDYANPAATAMFGYAKGALVGRMIETLVPQCSSDRHAKLRSALTTVDPEKAASAKLRLVRARHSDGHDFPMQLMLRRNDSSGRYFVFMLPVEEATGLGHRPAGLPGDPTHLPGPERLRKDLADLLADRAACEGSIWVILTELEQLAQYRATEETRHAEMLALACATRLRSVQGRHIRLYRAGENRFAFLVVLPRPHQPPERALAALGTALMEPLRIGPNLLHLDAGVGYACRPNDGIGAEALLANAALALQASLENRKSPVAYDHGLRSQVEHRNRVLLNLRHAIAQDQFELHYQPQVDLATGEVVALEALLRWRHPDWGLLMPADFMDVLGDSVLSLQVGEWVLREACRQVAAWNRDLARPLTIAVNIFPRQFDRKILPALVSTVLKETGLPPNLLDIEITEDTALAHVSDAAETLAALRVLGVGLVLDDFGTGYASLASLARHPVHKLKIDKSFVSGLTRGPACRAILESMQRMAAALGIETVVEGVETEETAGMMRDFGFDIGQGYLWSRPLDRATCAVALGLPTPG
ncbi:diguanylate cyclase/phosphodiesterase [Rhodobacter aestuarii]|uniref:Diguanylate cyclase/phosphodiesterase n=1 Tax=Rhodobacter aestuarii TaxID=453582 RepID=A0A1N7NFB4_9RHOB|nr:EAL domain-containing protein [Rhodobacter aestuarii]PTV96434.1 diguanylate cyclase/phosphodiesterase [Rhodobacter aestuarii]SIS97093.1 diguanylate cyclase/phosphodiesterase [Rhodobacter aestuarii]